MESIQPNSDQIQDQPNTDQIEDQVNEQEQLQIETQITHDINENQQNDILMKEESPQPNLQIEEQKSEEQKGDAQETQFPKGIVPKDPSAPIGASYADKKRKPPKDLEKLAALGFAYVGKSQLTCWHRPTQNSVRLLKAELGITMIVTVQQKSECPEDVKKACDTVGIKHMWIPLEGANKPLLENKNIQKRLKKDLLKLWEHISNNQEKVLIHCAAGIHRTGTTTYTLLRWNGSSPDESYALLKGIRQDTHKGVGDWRIALAEANLV